MNHSADPNTDFTDPVVGWAIRDIAEGRRDHLQLPGIEPGFAILPGRLFLKQAAGEATSPEIIRR